MVNTSANNISMDAKLREKKISSLGQGWAPGEAVVTDLLSFPEFLLGFNQRAGDIAKLAVYNEFLKTHIDKINEKSRKSNPRYEDMIFKPFSIDEIDKHEDIFDAVKQFVGVIQKLLKLPPKDIQELNQKATRKFLEAQKPFLSSEAKLAFEKYLNTKDIQLATPWPLKKPTAQFFQKANEVFNNLATKKAECSNFSAIAVARCLDDPDIREKYDILQVGILNSKHNICVLVPKGTIIPTNKSDLKEEFFNKCIVIDPWLRSLGIPAEATLFVPWKDFLLNHKPEPFIIHYNSGTDATLSHTNPASLPRQRPAQPQVLSGTNRAKVANSSPVSNTTTPAVAPPTSNVANNRSGAANSSPRSNTTTSPVAPRNNTNNRSGAANSRPGSNTTTPPVAPARNNTNNRSGAANSRPGSNTTRFSEAAVKKELLDLFNKEYMKHIEIDSNGFFSNFRRSNLDLKNLNFKTLLIHIEKHPGGRAEQVAKTLGWIIDGKINEIIKKLAENEVAIKNPGRISPREQFIKLKEQLKSMTKSSADDEKKPTPSSRP